MQLELTYLARIDLDQIRDRGVLKFGASQTRKYLFGLTQTLKAISYTPYMVRKRPEFHLPTRIHHFKAHIIAYRVESDKVKVVRVFSKYQDWMELL